MSPERRKKLALEFPELASVLLGDSQKELLDSIFEKVRFLKGEKGDTPTDEELIALIRPLIPEPIEGHTPTDEELIDLIRPLIPEPSKAPTKKDLIPLIKSLIPDPVEGEPGKDGTEIKAEQIAEKLNTLKEAIDASVIKGGVTKKEFDEHGKEILAGMAKVDGRIKLIDQRWHGGGGGGVSTVSHDGTLTGTGTPSSPLSVVSLNNPQPNFTTVLLQAAMGVDTVDITDVPSKTDTQKALKAIHDILADILTLI